MPVPGSIFSIFCINFFVCMIGRSFHPIKTDGMAVYFLFFWYELGRCFLFFSKVQQSFDKCPFFPQWKHARSLWLVGGVRGFHYPPPSGVHYWAAPSSIGAGPFGWRWKGRPDCRRGGWNCRRPKLKAASARSANMTASPKVSGHYSRT